MFSVALCEEKQSQKCCYEIAEYHHKITANTLIYAIVCNAIAKLSIVIRRLNCSKETYILKNQDAIFPRETYILKNQDATFPKETCILKNQDGTSPKETYVLKIQKALLQKNINFF